MEEVKTQGSYLKAILIAFCMGLIGVVAWVIIGGFANFISGWIAFLIAFFIGFGYDKAGGPKKGRIAIVITLYLIEVFISVYIMYYVILSSIIEIGFFDVFAFLSLPEIQPAMISDYITIAIFTVIGSAILFVNEITNKLNTKVLSGETKAIAGSRFNTFVQYNGDYEQISTSISELLKQEKFKLQDYGDEQVYCQGTGVWTALKFIKFFNFEDGIKIEAFVVINGRENDLEGVLGAMPKKALKQTVDKIVNLINENKN